jgi:hypothetical protein
LLFQFSPHVFLFHNNNILNAFGTTSARLIIEKLFMRTILAATVILAHNGLLILMVLFILHSFIKAYFLAAGLLQLVVDFTGGFDWFARVLSAHYWGINPLQRLLHYLLRCIRIHLLRSLQLSFVPQEAVSKPGLIFSKMGYYFLPLVLAQDLELSVRG